MILRHLQLSMCVEDAPNMDVSDGRDPHPVMLCLSEDHTLVFVLRRAS